MLSSTDSPQTIETDHTQSASVALHDQILKSVPKTVKRKAELLLGMINDNNNLTWDKQGVVSYKGKRIHGSNIIDLINDAIRQRKGVEPRGWKTFSKALHESNIPQEVIGDSVDGNGCKNLRIPAKVKNPIAYFTRQKVSKKC